MIKILLFLACCLVVSANVSFADNSKPCSQKDAMYLERMAAKVTKWKQMHTLYKRYHQCDDGAIAEGFSESVSIMLSQSWEQIGSLQRIIQQDASFEAFVLNHLDETLPEERLQSIENLARNSCPRSAIKLCENVLKRLKQI